MSPQETATEIVPLAAPRKAGGLPLNEAIAGRRSVREWSTGSLSSEELSQLLWAAQGVTGTAGERAAPSAGAVHPLLVHLLTAGGVHRYDPDSHCLERVAVDDRRERVADACVEQHFIARAPAVLVLAAARPSARASYGVRGDRYAMLEAGHVAQNVLLEAVSLGLVAVPIGSFYDYEVRRDTALGEKVDPLYVLPVGQPPS